MKKKNKIKSVKLETAIEIVYKVYQMMCFMSSKWIQVAEDLQYVLTIKTNELWYISV